MLNLQSWGCLLRSVKNFARVTLNAMVEDSQHKYIASAPGMNTAGCMLRMRRLKGADVCSFLAVVVLISLLGRSIDIKVRGLETHHVSA